MRWIWPLLMLQMMSPLRMPAAAAQAVSRQEYLDYAEAAAENGWRHLEEARRRWRQRIDLQNVFGYRPPADEVYLAALNANLYLLTGGKKYLQRIRELLLYYDRFKTAYPPEYAKSRPEYAGGLPTLPDFFTFSKYVHAYEILKRYGNLSPQDIRHIENNIAESADFLVNFQEWGAMNRAMLRAEALLYAAKVLRHHPHRRRWLTLGRAMARDNISSWEIEDATLYNAIWLYSYLGYASDVEEDEGLYRTPMMQYSFEYYLQLISPAGIVPDFGDANWSSAWNRMIPFFEKAAAVQHDPRFRWAAAQYFRKFLQPAPARKSIFTALTLSDACRWADFRLPAVAPANGSREVLEDIVGKKIVFRSGWGPKSLYLLLNYRDEGDGGWLFRNYLQTTIPTEEEKMHHGHSDENSIVLFMKNGGILLHDGGYRDFMPSGPFGAYRADYFHNRLVVRRGKMALGQKEGEYRYSVRKAVPGQSLLEFLRNSGAHRRVRTQKIEFLPNRDYQLSRTRLIDEEAGYEWDRILVRINELDWFVVFDVVRFTRDTYLTLADLWHTRQVLSRGEGWFDTAYDSLQSLDVRSNMRLLIDFPYREHRFDGMEEQRRYYQREKVVYQMVPRHGYPGDLQVFATVLIPHPAEQPPAPLVSGIRWLPTDRFPRAAAIAIHHNGATYLVGAKLDLRYELVRFWRRPMYTYESGRVRYGEWETDAQHLLVVETADSLRYAMSGGTKLVYRGQVLHAQKPVTFGLSFDGTPDQPGVGKMRYWEGAVPKRR